MNQDNFHYIPCGMLLLKISKEQLKYSKKFRRHDLECTQQYPQACNQKKYTTYLNCQ